MRRCVLTAQCGQSRQTHHGITHPIRRANKDPVQGHGEDSYNPRIPTTVPQPTQTRSNHARLDPGFHFTLVPLSLILFITCVVRCIRHYDSGTLLLTLLAFLLFAMLFRMRTYSLKVQDRVIRLEERLRLQALLPATSQQVIASLLPGQLIALRFASDAELPALAERAARESLTNRQIKDAIQTWRPDTFRV